MTQQPSQKQIELKFKRIIKKDYTKKNPVSGFEFADVDFGELGYTALLKVEIDACVFGEPVIWEYMVSYDSESYIPLSERTNPDVATEEKYEVKSI